MGIMIATFFCSCEAEELVFFTNDAAVFLVIDEESIDNGNEPSNFSERHKRPIGTVGCTPIAALLSEQCRRTN
nr:hypothetical protein [Haliscomenobacter sp.]